MVMKQLDLLALVEMAVGLEQDIVEKEVLLAVKMEENWVKGSEEVKVDKMEVNEVEAAEMVAVVKGECLVD